MNDPLSIQIHNRQRFEQNEPGEWLKLPATAEQLQEALRRVGITAENRQDFFINGIESPIEAVARLSFENVQAVGIDELNYLAARLEALDPAQIEKLNINSDMLSYWDDVHHLTEYVQNTECFLYIPGVTDHAALGDYYLNKSGIVQMPEGWKAAVNVERLGQLAAEQEKGVFWDNGYMLQTGDEWEPVNEIPQEYRIMSFPQPEPSHDDPIDYDAISTHAPAVATTPAPELAAVPQPVKPIVLESETAADKLKEITDKLEHGIAGIFESEQYADYLKTLSKFHNYSLNTQFSLPCKSRTLPMWRASIHGKMSLSATSARAKKALKSLPRRHSRLKGNEKSTLTRSVPSLVQTGNPSQRKSRSKSPLIKLCPSLMFHRQRARSYRQSVLMNSPATLNSIGTFSPPLKKRPLFRLPLSQSGAI